MNAERLKTNAGTALEGPLLITPKVFGDDRGFFFESWNEQAFGALLHSDGQAVPKFVQDNHSRSGCGVLRGLHFQLPPHPQGKLVRCVLGEIFDVAIDIRRSSATFGQWIGARLNAANHHQLWVPSGFAHGFCVLSEIADFCYKCTENYHPDDEGGIKWDDKYLNIGWPLKKPIISTKDKAYKSFTSKFRF